MAEKDVLGRAGEDRAARYLESIGYEVLDRNWRCAQGEIDIVAADGAGLCFIEVKTRSSLGFGHPFDAVDERKRQRLWHLAHAWCSAHPEEAAGLARRLDVIGIVGAEPETAALDHWQDLR